MLTNICKNCYNDFSVREAEILRGNGKFCSRKCSASYNNVSKVKIPNTTCGNCKKSIYVVASKVAITKHGLNFCNRECKEEAIKNNILENGWTDFKRKEFSEKLKTTSRKKYDLNPNKCKNCNNILVFNKRNNNSCSITCRKNKSQEIIKYIEQYRTRCRFKFSLKDYPDKFEFELITKYGWYSPSNKRNNLGGVSRDHMFSVRNGYELGIDPDIIAHPANCKLMLHSENFKKKANSSITLSSLLIKIEKWKEL